MTEKFKSLAGIFPRVEMLFADDVEQQAVISFGSHSFWLALPVNRSPEENRLVFVFSGHGGTGKNNNVGINAKPRAAEFRRNMLQAGFGFVCAACSVCAWGDEISTAETIAAAEYCRQQGLNTGEKLLLLGFSMGGLGALMFALREPDKTDKIVDLFGVTHLDAHYKLGKYTEELGPLGEAERLSRSPVLFADKLKNFPILIIHGLLDKTVDIANSRNLQAALSLAGGNSRLLEIPGYAHDNNILKEAGAPIRNFLE